MRTHGRPSPSERKSHAQVDDFGRLGSNHRRALLFVEVSQLDQLRLLLQNVHGPIVLVEYNRPWSLHDRLRSLLNAFVNLFRLPI